MTASSAGELASLRARAYGPHADIHADPVALARLRELEDALRADAASSIDDAPIDDAPIDDVPEAADSEPAEEGAPVTTEAEPVDMPESPPVRRAPRPIARMWVIAWAASVLVVALIVGGVVFGLASIKPVSPVTGATQVASLTEPADLTSMAWVRRWSAAGGQGDGYLYLGLVVVRTSDVVFASGSECLLVMRADGFSEADQSFRGPIYSGCRAGAFPAAVQFVVDAQSPPELRDRFDDGTGLSFVLDGDVVGVFAGDGPSASPTVVVAD